MCLELGSHTILFYLRVGKKLTDLLVFSPQICCQLYSHSLQACLEFHIFVQGQGHFHFAKGTSIGQSLKSMGNCQGGTKVKTRGHGLGVLPGNSRPVCVLIKL